MSFLNSMVHHRCTISKPTRVVALRPRVCLPLDATFAGSYWPGVEVIGHLVHIVFYLC
jgi:hypothetical protein